MSAMNTEVSTLKYNVIKGIGAPIKAQGSKEVRLQDTALPS